MPRQRRARILMDLQGPKLRVGRMAGGRALLETGSRFRFDLDPAEGTAARCRTARASTCPASCCRFLR